MSYMYDKVKNGKFSAAPEMCCSSKLGGWGGGEQLYVYRLPASFH